ncbi:MAG: hypothetical protein JXA90_03170 [Planctomycetes bacterium]|nr:hypothetical protein [Planctomycetota bacterium]
MKLKPRPLEERHPESAAEIAALRQRAEAAEADATEARAAMLEAVGAARRGHEALIAERDAARAEHAEFLRKHHFDAFEAVKAERDRLLEALRRLIEGWELEARRCAEMAAAFADSPAHWAGASARADVHTTHVAALRAALAKAEGREP